MGTEEKTVKTVDLKLRKGVFFPPWILLAAMVVVSLTNGDAFLAGLNAVTSWVLDNFAWAFNLTALGSVITVIVIWFSPLGKVRIGGSKARPMMKYMDLVWITLCTIIEGPKENRIPLCRTVRQFPKDLVRLNADLQRAYAHRHVERTEKVFCFLDSFDCCRLVLFFLNSPHPSSIAGKS